MKEEERAELLEGVVKILDICIMELKLDFLHFVLLAIVVLLGVYCAAGALREGAIPIGGHTDRMFQMFGLAAT